jgi:hypothetical protein
VDDHHGSACGERDAAPPRPGDGGARLGVGLGWSGGDGAPRGCWLGCGLAQMVPPRPLCAALPPWTSKWCFPPGISSSLPPLFFSSWWLCFVADLDAVYLVAGLCLCLCLWFPPYCFRVWCPV